MECSLCHRKIEENRNAIVCPNCECVIYCCEECRTTDWNEPDTASSHQTCCPTFSYYIQKETELCTFPFTYAPATTHRSFSHGKLKSVLETNGIYNKGIWRRICRGMTAAPFIIYGEMLDCGYYLNEEETTLSAAISTPIISPVQDWAGYYSLRRLSLDSLISALLTYPLTVYFIITTCLKHDFPDFHSSLFCKDRINIVLLGVEIEVEIFKLFQELCWLIPGKYIHIDFIGKNVSRKLKSAEFQNGRLTTRVNRTYYHNWKGSSPDIIIGLNAGIPAYKTWQPTIVQLQEQGGPVYFTEYSEQCVDLTDKTLKSSGLGEVTLKRINPFRSPLRIVNGFDYLPLFSNAFIFSIEKKSNQTYTPIGGN